MDTVKTLNIKKSCGLDAITNEMIKIAIHYICSPVTYLYNRIIKSGEYPVGWKISKVTPLFKKCDKSKPENYRPISLLLCLSKVFERIIAD